MLPAMTMNTVSTATAMPSTSTEVRSVVGRSWRQPRSWTPYSARMIFQRTMARTAPTLPTNWILESTLTRTMTQGMQPKSQILTSILTSLSALKPTAKPGSAPSRVEERSPRYLLSLEAPLGQVQMMTCVAATHRRTPRPFLTSYNRQQIRTRATS